MKRFHILLPVFLLLLLGGCAPAPAPLHPAMPETPLLPVGYDALPGWEYEAFDALLDAFEAECAYGPAKRLYGPLCNEARGVMDARVFFETRLQPYRVVGPEGDERGLVTGYYEPLLEGSLTRDARFRYPIYAEPFDLITVRLEKVYPELKGKRLRGRLVGRTLVPYESRRRIGEAEAPALCWVDDRIDRFFLEVQGSGRVRLRDGTTLYVGYANQNGRRYRSVGKYLVAQGEIPIESISLQNIRRWLEAHPERIDEVLHHNPSVVFFRQNKGPARGAMGAVLTPERSVAVDPRYLPLGAMLYFDAEPADAPPLRRAVFAQDTGGAIKGALRADYFWGYGKEAERCAGSMKAPAAFWILLPKERF